MSNQPYEPSVRAESSGYKNTMPDRRQVPSWKMGLFKTESITVLIDTTGKPPSKRGYRTEKGGAPIKENMAAAIYAVKLVS